MISLFQENAVLRKIDMRMFYPEFYSARKKYFFYMVKNFPQKIENTREIIENMSEIIQNISDIFFATYTPADFQLLGE